MEIKLALKVNDKDNVATILPMALPMVLKLRSATKKATLKPLP